jgi:hypothetical protein
MPNEEETRAVIQADREAAADLMFECGPYLGDCGMKNSVELALRQAFARHRQQTIAAFAANDAGGGANKPRKLTMPNGDVLECEYPDSIDWAKSWSIRYPDTGQIGTTGERDWELVETYGLTAIAQALINSLSPAPAGREAIAREVLPIVMRCRRDPKFSAVDAADEIASTVLALPSPVEGKRTASTPFISKAECESAAVEAVRLLEHAEDIHSNCPECEGEGVPELCGECFPHFDLARVQRRLVMQSLAALPTPPTGAAI